MGSKFTEFNYVMQRDPHPGGGIYMDYEDIIYLNGLFASFKNPGNNYKT